MGKNLSYSLFRILIWNFFILLIYSNFDAFHLKYSPFTTEWIVAWNENYKILRARDTCDAMHNDSSFDIRY